MTSHCGKSGTVNHQSPSRTSVLVIKKSFLDVAAAEYTFIYLYVSLLFFELESGFGVFE